MKNILLTILFLISFPIDAYATGKAFQIPENNAFLDNDKLSFIIHTPLPGTVLDKLIDPVEDQLRIGLARSPGAQENTIKYEFPISDDKRLSLFTLFQQKTDLDGLTNVNSSSGSINFSFKF
jgi:hypothetical protein